MSARVTRALVAGMMLSFYVGCFPYVRRGMGKRLIVARAFRGGPA